MANTEQAKDTRKRDLAVSKEVDEFAPSALFGDFDGMFEKLMRGFFMSPFERRLFDLPGFAARDNGGTMTPRAEFTESEKSYELIAELPGIDEKERRGQPYERDPHGPGRAQVAAGREGRETPPVLVGTELRQFRTSVPSAGGRRRHQDRGEVRQRRTNGDAAEEPSSGGAPAQHPDRQAVIPPVG